MKKLSILLALVIAVLLGYGVYLYNKPHKNVEKSKIEAEYTSDGLLDAFLSSDINSTLNIIDHVIAVEGTISEIDLSNAEEPQIVLITRMDDFYIRCGFKPQSKDDLSSLSEGETVKIKGLCQGLLENDEMDLLADSEIFLSECTIIE